MDLVPASKPEPRVTIEPALLPDHRGEPVYWVSRLRGDRCVASVAYSRAELEELRRRIDAVLTFGG